MNSALVEHHRDNNRDSAERWAEFQAHRERVTALAADGQGQSIALIGAGNCNDVDLVRLAQAYRSIHLFDIDSEAVNRACARQPAQVVNQLVKRAPIDATGTLAWVEAIGTRTVSQAELTQMPDSAVARVLAAVPERFDRVVSSCCLSQLMHSCWITLGEHPQLKAIAHVVALAHFRLLLGLLRPGGAAVLITDMLSSTSYPLASVGPTVSVDLLHQLDAAGNAFSGTALSLVRQTLQSDPYVVSLSRGVPRLVAPWLWHLGADRMLLVYALKMQRKD